MNSRNVIKYPQAFWSLGWLFSENDCIRTEFRAVEYSEIPIIILRHL